MFDDTDIRLLSELQKDAQLTTQELGETLGLSPSQVGRRRARLEKDGLIRSYTAKLNADMLGLHVQAFVQVQTATHDPKTHQAFLRLTRIQPQIIGAWTLTGEADYMLRILCEDLSALNRLVQEILLPHPAVGRVQSQIVMQEIKSDAPVPL